LPPGPALPEWADPRDLDRAIRESLRGLDPRNAERVAGHLVVAGTLVDDDPETALAHARAARDRASRVAVVREAVGVAAYHAGDFAEAAREIRAYRRMSGDVGYRAVLADCERALGRPEVALRLVAEALTDSPDAEEAIELRLVEAGARRDLGEHAAARLVLEAELGGRPTPGSLDEADPHRLRVAAAYADLLQEMGEEQLAEEWHSAVAAAEPDDMDIEFTELEFEDDDTDLADVAVSTDSSETDGADGDTDRSELEESLAGEPGNSGAGFDAEVEAEVAELLGEIDVPAEETGASGDDPATS
jgi:tetratricopeptide (TPR) repeat protein